MTSAHNTLDALDLANSIAPHASFLILPPLNPEHDNTGWIALGKEKDRTITPYTFSYPIDLWEGTGVLAIDYLYRDASNNKQHHQVFVKGTFSNADFCLIITALMHGDDESFIPHQLDMEDLQGRWNQYGYDDDEDHVWHQVTNIAMLTPAHDDMASLDLDAWMPLVHKRCLEGYNILEALRVLSPDSVY